MFKKTKLNQCTITLTKSCNLRCSFCYAKKTNYIPNDFIEYEKVQQIIDFCVEAKTKYIVLTGGEPTLYPYIEDVIRYIKSRNHKITATMATNGVYLSDFDYCKKIIDCGLDYIDISLKGWDSTSFQSVAGCDCFSQQLDAIKNLSKSNIDFTCSMVITPENVNSYCEAIKKASESGAKKFSFTFVIDNETSEIKDVQYLEEHNPFDLVERFLSYEDSLNLITKGEWWIEYSFPLCVYSKDQLKKLRGRLASPCQVHYENGITLDADMNLIPCVMNIDTLLCKFGKDFSTYGEFRKIVRGESYKNVIKELNSLPSEYCKSCRYLNDCLAGCPFFWKHCSFSSFEKFKESQNVPFFE